MFSFLGMSLLLLSRVSFHLVSLDTCQVSRLIREIFSHVTKFLFVITCQHFILSTVYHVSLDSLGKQCSDSLSLKQNKISRTSFLSYYQYLNIREWCLFSFSIIIVILILIKRQKVMKIFDMFRTSFLVVSFSIYLKFLSNFI